VVPTLGLFQKMPRPPEYAAFDFAREKRMKEIIEADGLVAQRWALPVLAEPQLPIDKFSGRALQKHLSR